MAPFLFPQSSNDYKKSWSSLTSFSAPQVVPMDFGTTYDLRINPDVRRDRSNQLS